MNFHHSQLIPLASPKIKFKEAAAVTNFRRKWFYSGKATPASPVHSARIPDCSLWIRVYNFNSTRHAGFMTSLLWPLDLQRQPEGPSRCHLSFPLFSRIIVLPLPASLTPYPVLASVTPTQPPHILSVGTLSLPTEKLKETSPPSPFPIVLRIILSRCKMVPDIGGFTIHSSRVISSSLLTSKDGRSLVGSASWCLDCLNIQKKIKTRFSRVSSSFASVHRHRSPNSAPPG